MDKRFLFMSLLFILFSSFVSAVSYVDVYNTNFDTDDWTDVGTEIYVDVGNSYLRELQGRSESSVSYSYKQVSLSDQNFLLNFTWRNLGFETGAYGNIMCLSNTLGNYNTVNAGEGICFQRFTTTGVTYKVLNSKTSAYTYMDLPLAIYIIEITKLNSSNNMNVSIWNSGRTTLIDSTSIDISTIDFTQTMYLISTLHNTASAVVDEIHYVYNLDLSEEGDLSNSFFAFNDSFYPLENHSFSRSYMNFSQDATMVNNTLNCSLVVNGNITSSNIYSNLSDESYYFNITFNESFFTPGEYNWSVSCFSNITNITTNSSMSVFYLDEVFPSILTSFVNNSIWFEDNLTAQFNFSDDFYLNSYNLSIDGVEVASNYSLSGTTAQLNLSTSIYDLDPGLHTLSVVLADGHTAYEIPDYDISNGLFGSYMEYSWEDSEGKIKFAKISNVDGSIFDSFSTKKEKDRYTWNFEPYGKKDNYEFIIETDDVIRIIEDDNTYLKSWITFGDKWMDFDLYGENSSVKIIRNGDKGVKVKISNIKNPDKQKYQSIGDLNIIEVNYSFYKLNASLTYQSAVFEGALTTLALDLETLNLLNLNSSAELLWGNVSKNVSRINVSNDVVRYGSTFLVPFVNSSNVSWTWFFNVSGYEFNTSGMSDFIQMNISNCSVGDYIVLNYTIYDEEFQTLSNNVNASIENFLTITTPDYDSSSYNFTIKQPSNNLLICLPNNTLNVSSWVLDALTKYTYQDHVEEFHYIENFLLNDSVIPKDIKLYDLAIADSTSFIITYQDENYIYVEDVVVDLLRQYTYLNGEFFSVEHGKTDQGGQTRLHFVTEDVIYKANVFDGGELVYTSGDFQAICQATPCQINLRKPYINDESISFLSNIYYSLSSQYEFYSNKQIVFDFSTIDGTSTNIIMNVSRTTSQFNDTICSSEKTLSAGSIVCIIPLTYYNATYTARVYKDGEFLGWRTYTMELNADDTFGRTGVFLAGLGYLMLSLMGISSAIASVILGVVGLMAMIGMNLIIGGSLFGIGSTFIWLIIAVGILIWKYQQRRVQ